MVFAGCSFTHGHGLWAYGDFDELPSDDNPLHHKITAYERFVQSIRFPRLVANHFNSWEFVRQDYSGDDENSVGLLHNIFKRKYGILYENEPKFFDYSDISHVIFQTSYIDRCSYIYNQENKQRERITEIPEKHQVNTLLDWGFENIEDYFNALRKQWYSEIRYIFEILESKGIKCYLLSITDDYLKLMENDSFMQDRFIKMKYDGKEFNTIRELLDYDKSLIIKNDYKNLKNPPLDRHPSLVCHKIIANSIIKKIEENE